MLAAWLFASLLAQAEPAPPEPPAAPAPQPDPSAALVSTAPGPNAVSVRASLAYRLDGGGETLGPAGGFCVSGEFERRYHELAGVELGAALTFSYQRFATGVEGSSMKAPGQEELFDGQRVLSKTGFALLQTVAFRVARLRPFLALGPGLVVSFFSSPELALRPGSKTAVQPIAEASAGLEVDVARDTAVVARVDVIHPFTDPVFTPGASSPRYTLFGDVLTAGFGLVVRF
jgi:hypothetical protein